MKNRGEKRHAAVVQRVTWSHRCGNSPARRRGGKSVVRSETRGKARVARGEARYAPGWPTSARKGWAAVPSARSTPRPAVRWARPRAPWRSRRRSTTAWQPLRPTARSPRGSRLGDRRRPARRRSRPRARRAWRRARASPPSSRLPRRRSWRRAGGTTRARHEAATGEARASRAQKNFSRRLDLAGRPRATFAGSAGTRERGRGRPESASRAGEEGACDHARRPTASAGRLPRGEVAENDVSQRSRTMTCAFVAPENKTPWHREFSPGVFPSQIHESRHRAKFEVGCRKALQWWENLRAFKSHPFVPRGAHPSSPAPGVSGRRRSRARRRGEFTGERSKGKSSDMPPRGMSAEVRARKRSFRAVPRFEMLSERATRGA